MDEPRDCWHRSPVSAIALSESGGPTELEVLAEQYHYRECARGAWVSEGEPKVTVQPAGGEWLVTLTASEALLLAGLLTAYSESLQLDRQPATGRHLERNTA